MKQLIFGILAAICFACIGDLDPSQRSSPGAANASAAADKFTCRTGCCLPPQRLSKYTCRRLPPRSHLRPERLCLRSQMLVDAGDAINLIALI